MSERCDRLALALFVVACVVSACVALAWDCPASNWGEW